MLIFRELRAKSRDKPNTAFCTASLSLKIAFIVFANIILFYEIAKKNIFLLKKQHIEKFVAKNV